METTVAIGNDKGKITLWHKAGNDKPVSSAYHWHSHGVSSVVFNSDGTYMLSGGEEAVLVIWQLETGTKRFLPRLGTYIHVGGCMLFNMDFALRALSMM